MKGYIHSFESLAAVDGDGIRYAVFLAGCPLRCAYCHNPDTWENAGIIMEAQDLVKKISSYKPYFKEKGGVTFSGGEPLLQAGFIKEMSPLLREKEISYVIDTSGEVELTSDVKNVLSDAQAVLLDLKFPDDQSYMKYTGHDMKKVEAVLSYLEEIGKPTVIRTVIIPDINDSEQEMCKYTEIVKDKKCVTKYELLAFHTMGFFKYEKLGIENPLIDTPPLEADVKERLQAFVNKKLGYK